MPIHDEQSHGWEWVRHRLHFSIFSAYAPKLLLSAQRLLQRRYEWRGYAYSPADLNVKADTATLAAIHQNQVLGTLSIGTAANGFAAEKTFQAEIAEICASGLNFCEFKGLAVETRIHAKEVLASLFHVAYLYARELHGAQSVMIEVNPRHVMFYKNILSFKQLGDIKMNANVNAPSALLVLEFSEVRALLNQVQRAIPINLPRGSYYPHFFSSSDEEKISRKILEKIKL